MKNTWKKCLRFVACGGGKCGAGRRRAVLEACRSPDRSGFDDGTEEVAWSAGLHPPHAQSVLHLHSRRRALTCPPEMWWLRKWQCDHSLDLGPELPKLWFGTPVGAWGGLRGAHLGPLTVGHPGRKGAPRSALSLPRSGREMLLGPAGCLQSLCHIV